jgi:hypothetical protein
MILSFPTSSFIPFLFIWAKIQWWSEVDLSVNPKQIAHVLSFNIYNYEMNGNLPHDRDMEIEAQRC